MDSIQSALAANDPMLALMMATVAQTLEQATDLVALNLQLELGASPEGVGELLDMVA